MRKGQLSFDMMIAIIVLLVTVQLFITLTNDMKESQEVMGIRAQQKSIALGIEGVLQGAMTFGGAGIGGLSDISGDSGQMFPFAIEYRIPEIKNGMGETIKCAISVSDPTYEGVVAADTRIVVTSTVDRREIRTAVPINIKSGFFWYETSLECGGKMHIRETK